MNELKTFNKLKTFIEIINKTLDDAPIVKTIIFAILGIKSIPKILIGVGIYLLSESPSLFCFLIEIAKKNSLCAKSEMSDVFKFSGILLIIIGVVLFYSDKKQKATTIGNSVSKNLNIVRTKDTKLFGNYATLFIFLAILIVEFIGLIMLIISAINSYNTSLILILFRLCYISMYIYLIFLTAHLIGCICYLIKGKKIAILHKKKNIFLECGKDKNIYLTSYEFYICRSCGSNTYLYRENERHYLVCSEYGNQTNHIMGIDPATFDKYSHP